MDYDYLFERYRDQQAALKRKQAATATKVAEISTCLVLGMWEHDFA
jgi:hypothetical protein